MNPNLACKDTNYFVSAIEITNNTLYWPHRESLLLTSLREPTTSLIANTHSSLSLIAGADPRSPKRKGDHIAQEMAGQARHEAKNEGYSFLSAQNTVKSRNASVVSEGSKPSKAFMVFS